LPAAKYLDLVKSYVTTIDRYKREKEQLETADNIAGGLARSSELENQPLEAQNEILVRTIEGILADISAIEGMTNIAQGHAETALSGFKTAAMITQTVQLIESVVKIACAVGLAGYAHSAAASAVIDPASKLLQQNERSGQLVKVLGQSATLAGTLTTNFGAELGEFNKFSSMSKA